MKAAILAVGSELLDVDRLDTNSLRLTAALKRFGVVVRHKAVVADDEAEIAAEVRRLAERVDLLLLSGGLGPTRDDVTREGVAQAVSRPLVEDVATWAAIQERFRSLGRELPAVNRRQALVIEGALVLANSQGTAPGQRLRYRDCELFLLPGVPWELEGLIETALVPYLESCATGQRVVERTVRVACMAESAVEEKIEPLYRRFGREPITVLAKPAEVQLRLRATGSHEQSEQLLRDMTEQACDLLGDAVFDTGRGLELEGVVGEELLRRQETVATAESCTAGLVAERLTRTAGSSGYFEGGVVVYSNALKRELLGVPESLLVEHGAVSEPVARAMAEGARLRLGSTWAIAITGIAGPGGGSDEKPVGTVHLAVAGPQSAQHRLLRLPGDRQRVRQLASQFALDTLRRLLQQQDEVCQDAVETGS